jgi:hypothetical protein
VSAIATKPTPLDTSVGANEPGDWKGPHRDKQEEQEHQAVEAEFKKREEHAAEELLKYRKEARMRQRFGDQYHRYLANVEAARAKEATDYEENKARVIHLPPPQQQ